MGVFNPATFLETTTTEANDTVLLPPPVGEYPGICQESSIREAMSKDGLTKYTFFETPIELDASALTPDGIPLSEACQRDKISVRYSCSLDLTESGSLDMGKGKNVGLGRLREACGLNQPGVAFSPRQIQGRPLMVSVKHRIVDDVIYADVKSVAPL